MDSSIDGKHRIENWEYQASEKEGDFQWAYCYILNRKAIVFPMFPCSQRKTEKYLEVQEIRCNFASAYSGLLAIDGS